MVASGLSLRGSLREVRFRFLGCLIEYWFNSSDFIKDTTKADDSLLEKKKNHKKSKHKRESLPKGKNKRAVREESLLKAKNKLMRKAVLYKYRGDEVAQKGRTILKVACAKCEKMLFF